MLPPIFVFLQKNRVIVNGAARSARETIDYLSGFLLFDALFGFLLFSNRRLIVPISPLFPTSLRGMATTASCAAGPTRVKPEEQVWVALPARD